MPLRSLVSGKSVVDGVEYPASYDFLHAIDGVNDAAALFKTWQNPARRPRWCWAATPRVPPSWTSSPQPAADPWIHKSVAGDRR